jgi:hypothetical protein
MRVTVYLEVTTIDDNNIMGYRTHVVTFSNETAASKFVEHVKWEALDNADLKHSDFLVYDDEVD